MVLQSSLGTIRWHSYSCGVGGLGLAPALLAASSASLCNRQGSTAFGGFGVSDGNGEESFNPCVDAPNLNGDQIPTRGKGLNFRELRGVRRAWKRVIMSEEVVPSPSRSAGAWKLNPGMKPLC